MREERGERREERGERREERGERREERGERREADRQTGIQAEIQIDKKRKRV
jgi:hypothetical protein